MGETTTFTNVIVYMLTPSLRSGDPSPLLPSSSLTRFGMTGIGLSGGSGAGRQHNMLVKQYSFPPGPASIAALHLVIPIPPRAGEGSPAVPTAQLEQRHRRVNIYRKGRTPESPPPLFEIPTL